MRAFISEARDCHSLTVELLKRAALSSEVPLPVLRLVIAFVDQVVQDIVRGDPHSARTALHWIHSNEEHFMSLPSVAELLGLSRDNLIQELSRLRPESLEQEAA